MEFNDIVAGGDPAAAQAAQGGLAKQPSLGAASSLGQQDFLKMLIAQLENQDPLDPQDATEFTAQLATFSSLDQLVGMRVAMDNMAEVTANSQRLSTASLVGHEVTAEASELQITEDARPDLSIELDHPVERVIVELADEFGRIAARTELDGPRAGRHEISWASFDRAPAPGRYDIRVSAGVDGLEAARALVRDTVTGASLDSSAPQLLLGDVKIPFSAVRELGRS